MNDAHDPTLEVHGEPLRAVLKRHGLRYSRPREVILSFLLEGDKHVSAESLYVALKQRGEDLSLSTVYLNLSVLAEAGLVREFKGAAGQSMYDSNVSPHYHVVCRETGAILDVAAPIIDGKPLAQYLKDTIEAATGWVVDEPRLSLSGLSPDARRAHRDGAHRDGANHGDRANHRDGAGHGGGASDGEDTGRVSAGRGAGDTQG